MAYQLGVDLGTTYSAAAISRDGRAETVTLGSPSPVVPSVVLLRADGEVIIGEAAVRRGYGEPNRVAREFKRRLGDPAPILLGGTPYGAEALSAHLLREIVKIVRDGEGESETHVVLTHPANFGPYKLEQMREVARLAELDLDRVSYLTEPQAAAVSYASRNRVELGEVIAVYDLGGGTFDAALAQRTDDGFTLAGRPEGIERFGGIDIDAAILAHVDHAIGGRIAAADPNDASLQSSIARLRDDCRLAKETLSSDLDTSISVELPGVQLQIPLTRVELETIIQPRLVETVAALDRTVRSAGLTMNRIDRVLLVGGSSRMPLVGRLIAERTGRPIAVDAHPKFAVALGAAACIVAGQGERKPTPVRIVEQTPTRLPGQLPLASLAPRSPATAAPPPNPPNPSLAPITPPSPVQPGRGQREPGIGLAGSLPVAAPPASSSPAAHPSAGRAAGVATTPHGTIEHSRSRAKLWVSLVVVGVLAAGGGLAFTLTGGNSDDDGAAPAKSTPGEAPGAPGTVTDETAAPDTAVSPTDEAVAQDDAGLALAALLDSDRPFVETLVDRWVPQVSAKKPGVEADGIVYQLADILALHRELAAKYGALLLSSSDYNYRTADLFVSVVPKGYFTADEALQFCVDEGINRDNCFAKLITHDTTITLTAVLQP